MRIDIITTNAKALDDKIFESAGDPLKTWEVRNFENTGKRFLTPVASQYTDVVVLQFTVNDKNDILSVTPHYWTGRDRPTDEVFAIVMGMFTSALLTHFGTDFSKLETTN